MRWPGATTRVLSALFIGAILGLALARWHPAAAATAAAIAQPIGRLWLSALQMTVVPLVLALVILGVATAADAATSGRVARRAMLLFVAMLSLFAAYAAIVAPALLSLVPRSPQLAATLAGSASAATASAGAPSLAEWVSGVIPSNAIMAAAQGAMLPVVVFAAPDRRLQATAPRKLRAMAAKSKAATQMGNQGSSSDGTRQTEALVQSGAIGDVHTIEVWTDRPVWPQGVKSPKDKGESQPVPAGVDWDLWLGTAPKRDYHEAYMPFRWRGYWDFGTGALGDMGCHFIDVPFRALKLGYPTSVECSVGSVYSDFFQQAFFDDVCPPSANIHLKFASKAPGKEISFNWYDGGMRPQLPDGCDYKTVFGSVDGGMLFIGTKGIISAEMFGENPRLWPEKKFENVRIATKPRALVPGGWPGVGRLPVTMVSLPAPVVTVPVPKSLPKL